MDNIRKVSIEKWVDALRDLPDEPDFLEEPTEKDGIWSYGDLKELAKEEELEKIKSEHKTNMKVLSTPHGVIPLTEYSFVSKYFNFWVVHTNFPITKPMLYDVADIDGIEDILAITKHRFRISVGKMFTVKEVVGKIQDLLCLPTNKEIEDNVHKQVKELKDTISNINYWAIFVLPNGRILHAIADEPSADFDAKLAEYVSTHKLVGGILWNYENLEPIMG